MFRTLFSDFLHLIYPHLCAACDASLLENESGICTSCRYKLPSMLYCDTENPASKKFWGRIPFNNATALFEFRKAGKVQKLIHRIKYNSRTDAAEAAGQMLGLKFKKDFGNNIDAVVPVPMHHRKIRTRGYNQAWHIAAGVCTGYFSKSIMPTNNILIKTRNITSQTIKSRAGRLDGLLNVYSLSPKIDVTGTMWQGAHFLLVDDVITTGATIEACALQLLKIPDTTVSVAALADVNF